jgi:hypothetical protein
VRKMLLGLPEPFQLKTTWGHIAVKLDEAARGGDIMDVVVPLRMVLGMEGIRAVFSATRAPWQGQDHRQGANKKSPTTARRGRSMLAMRRRRSLRRRPRIQPVATIEPANGEYFRRLRLWDCSD